MLVTSRRIALALMWAVVLIAFALFFAGGNDTWFDVPPLLAPIVVLASAVFVHFVIESTGYRTPAVPPGTPEEAARATSTQAFGASQFKRMLPAEVPALVAVALAYATVDGGFFTYCTGALASIVLMALHAWPGEVQIAKVQASLERDGGDSYLREVLAG